jgi:outer membrane murein-binding lipoprotein Lpp
MTLCWRELFTSSSNSRAQSPQSMQKIEQLTTQLQLTPQQKTQLAPILEAEAPKVQAIGSEG